MRKINIGTVFSGIGSFEFAMKRLGLDFKIIFACDNGEIDVDFDSKIEFEKIRKMASPEKKCEYSNSIYRKLSGKKNYVKQSYLENFDCKETLYFEDIRLLDGKDFKNKIDIFVGGSPCQSFSSVGFQGGLEDARGTLFYEFARLVKEIQPKVFIYENVRNLLKHDGGKTWGIIKSIFDSLGYTYSYDVLNASDFGIPQTRRRLFVIGFKEKCNFQMPKPTILKYKMSDFLLNNCAEGNFLADKKGNLICSKVHSGIDEKYYLSPLLYKYVMSTGTKSFYQKPEINKNVARTLLKTMGNRHRAGVDNYVSDDGSKELGKVRMLTEREAHRLMGFTDNYKIVVSRAQAYKQAGNSIVVDVMIAIIKEIIKTGMFKEG